MACNSNRIITFASLAVCALLASSARAQSHYRPYAPAQPAYRTAAAGNQAGYVAPQSAWTPVNWSLPAPAAAPPQASATPPEADRKKAEREYRWDEHHGLFGPVRIGPVVGAGFPNIFSYGVTAKLWGYVGLGLNWGQTPEMQFSYYGQANVRYREFDAYARVHPFRGGFFVGLGAGHHSVQGTLTNSFQVADQEYGYTGSGRVKSTIVTPQIGYFRNFAFGLAIGIDIGAQIPVKSSDIAFDTTISGQVPAAVVAQAEQPVRDTLDSIGKTVVPAANVRIGWLF